MSFVLITPPLVEPISLVEAKAHLRVTHADDDDFISRLIISARRQVEARTGLRLISQVWRLSFDCWPNDGVLLLPLSPLLNVIDIKIWGADDAVSEIDPAHYFVDLTASPPRLALRSGRTPPKPGRLINGVEVTVTAGFGTSAASVPSELKQALLLIVGAWFAHRGDTDTHALPLFADEILRPFRVRRIS